MPSRGRHAEHALDAAEQAARGPEDAPFEEPVRAAWVEHGRHDQATGLHDAGELPQCAGGVGVLEDPHRESYIKGAIGERHVHHVTHRQPDAFGRPDPLRDGLDHRRRLIAGGDAEVPGSRVEHVPHHDAGPAPDVEQRAAGAAAQDFVDRMEPGTVITRRRPPSFERPRVVGHERGLGVLDLHQLFAAQRDRFHRAGNRHVCTSTDHPFATPKGPQATVEVESVKKRVTGFDSFHRIRASGRMNLHPKRAAPPRTAYAFRPAPDHRVISPE